MTDPQPEFRPLPGQAEQLEPSVRRILAPNPSPMTFRGTNTYLVGERDIAIIDPGPDDPRQLLAILEAIEPGQRISHILVTHAHLDHSPLARPLADRTGAPILAFGRAEAGRSATMQRLAEQGLVGGGEGVDLAFAPDICLSDGDSVETDEWRIGALHLPGHMANHLGFVWQDTLFSGDLVMGWATSLVSPPDGDLSAFMASLDRLSETPWRIFYPGHGAAVKDPQSRVEALAAHRTMRKTQIQDALQGAPATAAELTAQIYTDIPEALLPAAERNVLAHLLELVERNMAEPEGPLSGNARFTLKPVDD